MQPRWPPPAGAPGIRCTGRGWHLFFEALCRGGLTVLPFVVAGCVGLRETPQPAQPTPDPAPIVVAQSRREAVAPPAPRITAPMPRTEPERQSLPAEPEAGRVAIVLSDRSPAYENVAIELGRQLERFLLYDLADKSLTPDAVFSGIADSQAEVVIAIGLKAAERAMALSTLPIVFCQVFNIDVSASVAPIRGVAAIPPLRPQVRAWKRIHPELESIGAILGEGHEDLIAEAQIAAAENGIGFQYRIVGSDRETLYVFNRMAREIDGFWLFPDNRVLSMEVLKELLRYGDRHGVQVAVFNPALLALGAELSVTSVDADVAARTIAVAERIMDGELEAVPAVTPLGRADMHVAAVAAASAAKGAR
ncbi:MAG TPA: ABC transporter substrate binding protein [Woeseiaceae bacterium]|nr:ABC transporter substrate binding protein [Woeseiaceae bacterium]